MGWRVRHVPLCRQSSWPASILHLRIQSLPCDSKRGSFVNQTSAYTHDLSLICWRRNHLMAKYMSSWSLWINVKQCNSVIQMERDHNWLKVVFYSRMLSSNWKYLYKSWKQGIQVHRFVANCRIKANQKQTTFESKIDWLFVQCATLIIWLRPLKCFSFFAFCFFSCTHSLIFLTRCNNCVMIWII